MMKPKTKEFLDKVISDDKISATQAYLDTHRTTNRRAASVEASKTLAKPSSQIYMKKHVSMAKRTIVDIAMNSDKDETRLKASQDILDRTDGKAIQKTINQNTNLNLNIEASKELADNFTEFLKSKTSHVEPV